MPASSPPIDDAVRTTLTALGSRIRARRMELRLSMNATAEAAGVSRVTLHRIERGGPSVTMGAYLNVISALGLSLNTTPADRRSTTGQAAADPTASVRIGDYPQLRLIAWQFGDDAEIAEADALLLYERNWRHVDHAAMLPREQQFLQHLVDTWGHGRLLV
jgi:transcriptional regulator with XRE-family HTH domain